MKRNINKFIKSLCNIYNNIANFIRRDKDVISVIISFWVGVGSILVGCVAISVSNQQVNLTNRQVELQELIEQPIFRIEKDFVDTYNDGREFNDTKVINLYNDGNIPRSIQKVDVDEILKFEIHRDNRSYELLVRIPAFYRIQSQINSLTGKVFTGFSRGNYEEYYQKLYLHTLEETKIGEFYFISSFTLTSIDYIDKFGNSHSLYFNDNNHISKEEFNSTHKRSKQYETEFFMDIDSLSYEELMNIAEEYIKEQNDNQK